MASSKAKGNPNNAEEIARLQKEDQKSRRFMWVGVGAGALAVIALVITMVIFVGNQDSGGALKPTAAPTDSATVAAPETEEMPMDLDGVPTGGMIYNPSGKSLDEIVTLSIYSDFACGWCGKFEAVYGEALVKMAEEGKIALDYHPMPHLQQESMYSARTSQAAYAVGTLETDKLPAFIAALMNKMPQTEADILTDAQIGDVARQVGVSEETIAQFAADEYKVLSENSKAQATKDVVKVTPSVLFDGARYKLTEDDFDPQGSSIFLSILNSKIENKK